MKHAALTLLALTCLAASAAAQAQNLPASLLQAVSATERAKADYAFDFELAAAGQIVNARFEPGSEPGLRLVSPARGALRDDVRGAFDGLAQTMEGVTWCAGGNMTHITNPRLVREDETTITYAFRPTRDSVTGEQTRRIVSGLRGELTLTKPTVEAPTPDVLSIRLFAPQPFSPLPLVRVERYSTTTTCAVAPNGRRYAAETVSDGRGSMLGQMSESRTVRRVSNLGLPR